MHPIYNTKTFHHNLDHTGYGEKANHYEREALVVGRNEVGKRHWRGYLSRSGRDGGGRKRDVVLSGALTASQIRVD